MKTLISPILIVVALASCEQKTAQKTSTVRTANTSSTVQPLPDSLQVSRKCYLGVTGKDSVMLSLENNLGTLVGNLAYKNAEKDSSTGTVVGNKSGDTLKLTYTFQAEGTTSDREIWFLLKGKTLSEGIGQYDDKGVNYENYKTIKFSDGQQLKQTDCSKLSANF